MSTTVTLALAQIDMAVGDIAGNTVRSFLREPAPFGYTI